MINLKRDRYKEYVEVLWDKIKRAENIHPEPTFPALIEEVAEVANELHNCDFALSKEELYDVLVVAMRLIYHIEVEHEI